MITLRTALSLSMALTLITACRETGDDVARDTVAMTPDSLATDSGWVASPRGVGGVRVGMLRPELLDVIGQPSRAGYYTHAECVYIRGSTLPPGMQVMMIDSAVARIDIEQPGVRTREGVQVGDSASTVLQRYRGRVATSLHAYTGPTGQYLTVTPPGDTVHRIIFETDGAVITNYRVGRRPQVEWVEGCS